jgi:hypothetical protein
LRRSEGIVNIKKQKIPTNLKFMRILFINTTENCE